MNIKIIIKLFFVFILFIHCEKDELFEPTENGVQKNIDSSYDNEEKMIELIKRLENPYSVEAMSNSQDTLIKLGLINNPIEIQATHYYVRFLPSTWEELDLLEIKFENENNELFDYPLDYELSIDGTYYHDPSLPDSAITWQYTVVKIDYIFPNVEYEILDNLFLFDDEVEVSESNQLIEDVSLFLTNNWDSEDEFSFYKSEKASKWKPSGTINALDEQLGYVVPVEGVKVTMRRWFKWSTDYTDHNGYFESNKKFKKKVNYKIKWVTPKFRIRSGWYGSAWTIGPKKKGSWNVNITQNLRLFYATIHRSAHDFFYHDPFGLKKPNTIPKLKIAGLDKCGTGVMVHFASIVGGPDIRIYRKTPNVGTTPCSIKSTLSIYGTTIHELGHSNHRANGYWNFIFSNTNLTRESWADCVEWAFVMEKYYPGSLYSNDTKRNFMGLNRQYIGANFNFTLGSTDYTTLFIDLIDCSIDNSSIDEGVCGYNLIQIEEALKSCVSMSNVDVNLDNIETSLVNLYFNQTEQNINKYFYEYKINY